MILIACATYKGAEQYLIPYIEGIRSQTFTDYELVFCDNSDTDEFAEKLKEFGTVLRSPSNKNIHEALELAYNKLRDYFLAGDYTHMWIVEADQVVQPDALERLLKEDKDVIGCPYPLNQNNDIVCVHDPVTENIYKVSDIKLKVHKEGPVFQVWGCGHGAVLAKRHVLEKIPFRIDEKNKLAASPDTFWYQDIKKAGIKVYCLGDCWTDHLRISGGGIEYPTGIKTYELPELTVVRCRGDFWNSGINPKFFIMKGQKKVLPRIIDEITYQAIQNGLLIKIDPVADEESKRLVEEELERKKLSYKQRWKV